MSRPIMILVYGSLIAAVVAFAMIVTANQLTTTQTLGTAGAFLLGWIGFSMAGSHALRKALARKQTRRDAAVKRVTKVMERDGTFTPQS